MKKLKYDCATCIENNFSFCSKTFPCQNCRSKNLECIPQVTNGKFEFVDAEEERLKTKLIEIMESNPKPWCHLEIVKYIKRSSVSEDEANQIKKFLIRHPETFQVSNYSLKSIRN
eukprot:gene7744-12214_t